MEAIGRLTGGIAHDFNNLLAVILGNGELLRDALPEQDPRRTEAVEIVEAAHRAASLTRQLLAFSRRQVLEPTRLDLNSVVSGLERMLGRVIGEDVELSTSLAPALGAVRADAGQIEQVLMNLAVNARDAMTSGGRLIIETANVWREPEQAADRTTPVGPCVMIAVTDTGCGMDDETARRAFEPFFTTKGPGKGTGLGLSTCYGIVQQSGGQISIYSEPGRGSVFKVCLPCCDREVAATEGIEMPDAPPRGDETILLVEDDAQVRAAVARMLAGAGYRVVEVGSGEEALDALATGAGRVRLVLTDVVLPGLSGPELVDRLARFWPELPAVCMSGYTDHMLRDQVLRSGLDFMQKPFGPAALARTVRQALERSTATDRSGSA
jgi:CheY-like chemotaxis protein